MRLAGRAAPQASGVDAEDLFAGLRGAAELAKLRERGYECVRLDTILT